MNKTYEYYAEEVSRPGKFEGCAPYVPYLWEQDLEWDGDSDIGNIATVKLEADDFFMFPELEGKTVVYLYETSYGFVHEIDEEEYRYQERRIEQFFDAQRD